MRTGGLGAGPHIRTIPVKDKSVALPPRIAYPRPLVEAKLLLLAFTLPASRDPILWRMFMTKQDYRDTIKGGHSSYSTTIRIQLFSCIHPNFSRIQLFSCILQLNGSFADLPLRLIPLSPRRHHVHAFYAFYAAPASISKFNLCLERIATHLLTIWSIQRQFQLLLALPRIPKAH